VKRLSNQFFEWAGMTRRGPQLQLGIAVRPHLHQGIGTTIVQVEPRNHLGVAPIEAFREAQHGGQGADGLLLAALQMRVLVVAFARPGPPMIPCHEGHGINLIGLETPQVSILDQIPRVFVMAFIRDMNADIVKNGRIFQPFPLAIGAAMKGAGLVEQHEGEPRDVVCVLRPVVAAFGEFDDAAAPDVGIAIGLRNLLAVLRDVLEDQPLSQREVAQRDFLRAQPPQDGIEEDGASGYEIGAARIEAWNLQPALEGERDKVLAHAVDLLGWKSPVSQRRIG
jgi:hypothetical protein